MVAVDLVAAGEMQAIRQQLDARLAAPDRGTEAWMAAQFALVQEQVAARQRGEERMLRKARMAAALAKKRAAAATRSRGVRVRVTYRRAPGPRPVRVAGSRRGRAAGPPGDTDAEAEPASSPRLCERCP